jgi:predicted ribonuclease toxin of YeeF-YezG toxin-antitoxin module
MEKMLTCLLAEMNAVEDKTDANLRKIKAEIRTNREEMRTNQEEMTAGLEDKIVTNNDKFEVLRCTLVTWVDTHHDRTESTEGEMKVKIDIHQEEMEAALHSIRCELDKTINDWWRRPVVCRPKDTGLLQGTD